MSIFVCAPCECVYSVCTLCVCVWRVYPVSECVCEAHLWWLLACVKGLKLKPPLLMIPEPCRDTTHLLVLRVLIWAQSGPGCSWTCSGPSVAVGAGLTYSDLVVDELAGHVHLLGGASDGEDPGVGVGGGRRVPLQLHVSSRLLVDALDGFSTCTDGHVHNPDDSQPAGTGPSQLIRPQEVPVSALLLPLPITRPHLSAGMV